MKKDKDKDYAAPCFFRRRAGSGGPFCSVRSISSPYEISPEVCAQCAIPAQPCQHLDVRVLIAPGLEGKPIPRALSASCRKKEIRVNEVTFEECIGCLVYEPARLPGEGMQDLQARFVDGLTGLFRREYFDANLEDEVRRARSMGWGLALILADIDHFKRINDTYGHLQGDNVLRAMGAIAKDIVGDQGVACRYGGEEIALILPRLEKKEAAALGEEFRRTVDLHLFERIDKEGENIPVTLSAGVSLFPSLAKDPVELIRQADQALYRAKESGRNRVVLYDPKRDIEEVPILLWVTFHGFPEISNSGKISLDRWTLGDSGSLEDLVALDLFDHQRAVRSISEDAKPGRAGAVAHPIEGTAREIVRQGSLTRFRLAVKPKAYSELEKAVRKGGKEAQGPRGKG
jgi:diguanylate cyclase (GGDEF)-like protein